DRFRKRLDYARSQLDSYRQQWGFGAPQPRTPDDITFVNPLNIELENVHYKTGQRTTRSAEHLLNNLVKRKEGWDWRYVDSGSGSPPHIEITMGAKGGPPIVRQVFFAESSTNWVKRNDRG